MRGRSTWRCAALGPRRSWPGWRPESRPPSFIPTSHVDLSGPHYFHSTAAQAYIAGATQRIRIGTSITILPLQHPIVMAKALSTVDWMSSGRIVVAFGVGWLEKEFDALGVPFHERGRMSDEYLAAIVELWTKERPSFEGKYVSFKDVAFEPKPFQKPHLPIWMGGDSDAALKRAARFASGSKAHPAGRPTRSGHSGSMRRAPIERWVCRCAR